uniref:PDZ domain-containing protein n=1 Tax=Alexandrium catenella TaxID=2925 RepID=A0A7S1L5P2_ALECA|mmetsp:Transcript_106952/g.284590  ORF Transcript_106952/g.284590 Transcript_106952/m.284590 type:complete len:155 (+) Transcript_106952:62-526(+)
MGGTCCAEEARRDGPTELTQGKDITPMEQPKVSAAALATSESVQPANEVIIEAKQVEEPQKSPKGPHLTMVVEYGPDKERSKVYFTRTPLGMSFNSGELPIVVKEVQDDGEAKDIGVRDGMVIVEIAGSNIVGMSYDDAFALMKRHAADLPRKS